MCACLIFTNVWKRWLAIFQEASYFGSPYLIYKNCHNNSIYLKTYLKLFKIDAIHIVVSCDVWMIWHQSSAETSYNKMFESVYNRNWSVYLQLKQQFFVKFGLHHIGLLFTSCNLPYFIFYDVCIRYCVQICLQDQLDFNRW